MVEWWQDLLEVLNKESKELPKELSAGALAVEEKARKFLETVEAKYNGPAFAFSFPNIFQGLRFPGS